MFQEITIIGNLGETPELRYTPSNVAVTTFSVAANRTWTNQDGSRGEKTVWFRVTAWRSLAETICRYMTQGRQIFVKGEMEEARPWTGNDGEVRASLEVTAQTVKFLGSANGNGNGNSTNAPAPASAQAPEPAQAATVIDEGSPW